MLSCPASRCPSSTRNRSFSSADALLEHARQSKSLHPLCSTCLRIFKDTAALDQHVEAKHVVVCQPCNRRYKSQSALDQHWRASSAHPNCPMCETSAPDAYALAEHITNAHPKVRCCGALLNESDLDMHYLASRNHPTCKKCNVGFATDLEYTEHNSKLHPELQCKVCAEQFSSLEALRAHVGEPSSHRRCEFCSAQFKDTSALVEHFTQTHLPRDDDVQDTSRRDSVIEILSSTTHSPSPPMNQPPYISSSSRPSSVVFGAGRATAGHPEPPGRGSTSLSTSISDIASELYHSPPSASTLTPSPSFSGSFSNLSHSYFTALPALPSQQRSSSSERLDSTFPTYAAGSPIRPAPGLACASPAVLTPPLVLQAPPSPSPHLPASPQVVGPVTPARKVHSASSQLQPHQPQSRPPSSVRSKLSVAETPSGDLANFHLLKGSPLQSVVDFDTPTPSPRTPSILSASPAEAQALPLVSQAGNYYLPPTTEQQYLPSPTISSSMARAQRSVSSLGAVRSSFYCRVCQVDPCHEITATVCGHVFCNTCIVEEVRENGRCPVCNAMVLLFALLKLEVS
ncbi:hypothetical protein B0F90DRAFT_1701764 [Multifurca ochricompacta]|uniref:RING-type domain-containing protein n=1 Tax=Multifurca ochricompacta TaxID=376703 RepID=A0AAD4M8C0_9AGAM|nr:hypothetical protein B0F90DRAFT_1701764 [Multifurca ochricompacta]